VTGTRTDIPKYLPNISLWKGFTTLEPFDLCDKFFCDLELVSFLTEFGSRIIFVDLTTTFGDDLPTAIDWVSFAFFLDGLWNVCE
jgi:hypothetical protein